MCRLFIGADARLWRTRLKSVRMRGYSTSVRLENFYWRVLEDIARRDGMNVPQLLAKLHEELIEAHGEIENFSSFLRVCCGRYLTLQLAGGTYADIAIDGAVTDGNLVSAPAWPAHPAWLSQFFDVVGTSISHAGVRQAA